GLTNKPAVSLVPLAKSWDNPPQLTPLVDTSLSSEQESTRAKYDYKQRAYVIQGAPPGKALIFWPAASEDSPLANAAFVVKNWGEKKARLEINGKTVERGRSFRYGHRHTLEGTDLIVWIKLESTRQVELSIIPAES
ncbi:MAG: hypothetical protein ACYS9T_10230, partial [Planctomycetota bacterium]